MTQAYNPNAIGSVVPIWAGGGGSPGPGTPVEGVLLEFEQADLVAGVFTGTHNRANQYVSWTLYDEANLVVMPDDAEAVDANNFAVTLTSFEPIPGTWKLWIVG